MLFASSPTGWILINLRTKVDWSASASLWASNKKKNVDHDIWNHLCIRNYLFDKYIFNWIPEFFNVYCLFIVSRDFPWDNFWPSGGPRPRSKSNTEIRSALFFIAYFNCNPMKSFNHRQNIVNNCKLNNKFQTCK